MAHPDLGVSAAEIGRFWAKRLIRIYPLHLAMIGLLLLALILAALGSGIGWSTVGLPSLDGYSALTIHATLGTAAVAILAPPARGVKAPLHPLLGGKGAIAYAPT